MSFALLTGYAMRPVLLSDTVHKDTLVHLQFITVKCEYEEKKMFNMGLETEVNKGFLVILQLLCVPGYLREKKTIKGKRYVHKIGEKEHYEIY